MSFAPASGSLNVCSGAESVLRPASKLGSIAAQRRAFVDYTRQSKMTVAGRIAAAAGSNASPVSTAPTEVSKRAGTILEAWEDIRKARGDVAEIPREFLSNPGDRPNLRDDEVIEEARIPIIDLSRAETDRAGVAKELYEAASDWGFFKLVNHGLSLAQLEEAEAEAFTFFDLPTETKQRLNEGGVYIGNNMENMVASLHWAESLRINKHVIDEIVETAWPDKNLKFRNAMKTFIDGSETITKLLMELLAEGLGLGTSFFSQHLNTRRTQALRLNYYPPCPWPSDCLGILSHTDGNSITVLYQDNVGGLQIQKDGKWMHVKPVEGSLVINIGDTLHAWTNGRLKSVIHRSVTSKTRKRLSLSNFMNVDSELLISAPAELVDAAHPRLYRPFKFMDYASHIFKTRGAMSSKFTEKRDGHFVLDEFRLE